MESPPESKDPSRPDRVRFQFGLGRLFVLTGACAGVLAVVSTMKAPVLFRLGVALYLMLMVAYVILRIPYIYQIWRHVRRRRLEAEMLVTQARIAAKEAAEAPGDDEPRSATRPDRPDG